MAKMIRYKTVITVNHGTESEPNMEQIILDKTIACADRIAYDANYPIAEKEAISGTIAVFGDFDREGAVPSAQEDTDAMLIDHEYRLTLLELGMRE